MCGSKRKMFSNSIETNHNPFHSLTTSTTIDGYILNHPEVLIQSPDTVSSSSVSDCESCVSGGNNDNNSLEEYNNTHNSHHHHFWKNSDRLVKLNSDERVHGLIKHRFLSCLPPSTKVVAIHRNNWSSSPSAQAKVQSFQVHRRLLSSSSSPDNDMMMKFAWFGTSKDGVDRIMSHGFGVHELEDNNGVYGRGIYLSPDHSPLDSVESAPIDDDGISHVLLCRVLLGKPELVSSTHQSHPSSHEFQSGVAGSITSPKKYIVWSTNMNTHILPEYVVSFKSDHPRLRKTTTTPLSSSSSSSKKKNNMKMKNKPSSPWMPFPALIQTLSDFLPTTSVQLIAKYHKEYRDRKIQRTQLIHMVRQLAGDELLTKVLKSWRSPKDQRVAAFDLNH